MFAKYLTKNFFIFFIKNTWLFPAPCGIIKGWGVGGDWRPLFFLIWTLSSIISYPEAKVNKNCENFLKKFFKKIQKNFRDGFRPVPPSLRVNCASPSKISQGFFIPSSKKIFLGGDYYSYTHYFPRLSKKTLVLGPSRRAQCHPTTARRAPISCGLAWRHPRPDDNEAGRSPLPSRQIAMGVGHPYYQHSCHAVE